MSNQFTKDKDGESKDLLAHGFKRCSMCREVQPVESFHKGDHRDGLSSSCKSCNSNRMLKVRYGITIDEYNAMLEQQGFRCAICKRHISELPNPLKVDHDHSCCPGIYTCGECIRGLLCQGCNSAIGAFQDDVARLQGAIDYLSD